MSEKTSKQYTGPIADLMREMGSPDGEFVALPPDQCLLFAKRPDVQLTPMQLQSIAYVWWHCVSKETGERGVKATDAKGNGRTLVHMQTHYGWDLSNASKIVASCEELGFYSRDEKGVFQMHAVVNPKRSEENANIVKQVVSTNHLPRYLRAHIKGLSEIEQKNFLQGWVASDEWYDNALAEAKAMLYARSTERKRELCRQVGAELKDAGGRPADKDRPNIVKMTFVLEPDADWFVHTSESTEENESGQTSATGSHKPDSEFVPETHPYSESSGSSGVSGKPQAADTSNTPPNHPTSEGPSNQSSASATRPKNIVVQSLEALFGRKLDRKLADNFESLATMFEIPQATVYRWIGVKFEEKRGSNYPIRNPGALYAFALEDIPVWLAQQHERDMRADWKWDEKDRESRQQHAQAQKAGLS